MTPERHVSFRHRLFSALLCGGLLMGGGCTPESNHGTTPQTPPGPPLPVEVVVASETLAPSQNEMVGTVEAVQRATLSPKVTGTITEMPVVLGATVKQGDLLVRLSAAEISARLSQAETAVAQAKRNLEREERLLARNASTQETVNTLKDVYEVANASQTEARTMLGYTTIRAPFSGRVSQKLAHVGDLATVGTPLLILENTKVVQAVIAVPEAQLARIKPGETLSVRIPAAGVETIGTVSEIAPGGDALSRTSVVKIDLAETRALRPGQFARVIIPGTASVALTVPEGAVTLFGQMERLFVVEKNIARLRLVRTGAHREGHVEILSGLSPGEQVVVSDTARFVDGQPVQVTP